MVRLILFGLALGLGWAGPTARAQDGGGGVEPPRAVLLVEPASPAAAEEAARLRPVLVATLDRSAELDRVPLEAVLAPEAEAEPTADPVAPLIEKGRAAYDNLELDRAVSLLERALAAAERNPADPIEPAIYGRGLTYLGASRVLTGDMAGGRRAFRRLLAFDPEAELDPMVFPPSLVETFGQVAAEMRQLGTGSLRVASRPAGARVWIDGRERGRSPLRVTGLPGGPHRVRLTHRSHRSTGRMVQVQPGHQAAVDLQLTPYPAYGRLRTMLSRLMADVAAHEVPPVVDGLLDWLDADRLLLVVVAATDAGVELRAYHWDGIAGQRLHAQRLRLASGGAERDERVGRFFAAVLADPTRIGAGGIGDPLVGAGGDDGGGDGDRDGGSIWTAWWFWTAVGVVVAGGVGTALGLTLGGGGQDDAASVVFRF